MVKDSDHSLLIAGRFEIRNHDSDLLGRGCVGEVYRATDNHSGELVAVKALDPKVVARTPASWIALYAKAKRCASSTTTILCAC